MVRINVHQSLQLSIFEKRMKLTINFLSLFQSENSFLSANFTFRDDGADKAFIDFIEASDLETAQKAFFQSCKALNLEPCGTIDTFYTSYRETMKVHNHFFPLQTILQTTTILTFLIGVLEEFRYHLLFLA